MLSVLYLTAGKTGTGASWSRTVSGLCGSMHGAMDGLAMASTESGPSSRPAPLDLPPLTDRVAILSRLEVLAETLCLLLRSVARKLSREQY